MIYQSFVLLQSPPSSPAKSTWLLYQSASNPATLLPMETSTSNQPDISTAVAESGATSLAFPGLWQAGQAFVDASDEGDEGDGGEEEQGDEMLGEYEMEDEPNAELSALQTELAEALTHQVAMQQFGPEYQELARKKVTKLHDKIALASK